MRGRGSIIAGVTLWAGVLIVCGLPLAWTAAGVLTRPAAWGQVADLYNWTIHGRTLAYSLVAATAAVLVAVGPGVVLARGGLVAAGVLALAAAVVAVPEAAWAYGFAEAWRQAAGTPVPESWADVMRATLTTAAQVWPVPAAVLAVALRRMPGGVLDAAELDGARRRVVARLALPAVAAGWAGALLLAGRQVTAYDQSGIVTTGVLVREAYVTAVGGGLDRAAAAAGAGAPVVVGLAALAGVAGLWFRGSINADHEASDPKRRGSPAFRLGRGGAATLLGVAPALLLALVPLAALVRTAGSLDLASMRDEFAPQLRAGLTLAAIAACACALLALLATVARPRGAVWFAVAAFLAGGQLVALGLLRLLNAPLLPQPIGPLQDVLYEAAYDRPLGYAWPAAALFAWLPLSAAAATWTGATLALRRQAAADGANGLQTAAYVVWPLAWPGLLTATAAAFALSLAETPAAVLTYPDSIVNTMMSNVHTLAYAPMARAAVLGAFVCGGVAAVAGLGWWAAEGRGEKGGGRRARGRGRLLALALLLPPLSLLPSGCDRPPQPEAVWLDVGTGAGQVVYPRAAVYSAADDAVWVVDREARVQKLRAEDGSHILDWRMPDWRYGKPVGLGVDDAGNLYVPDTHYGRVIVYSPDGEELYQFGQSGTGPGQFVWPTDVAVMADGRMLVSEYGAGETGNNDRVQVFRRGEDGVVRVEGQIGTFGTGPGEFRRPQSLIVLGDVLWVTDAAGHRLLSFSLRDANFGAFLRALGDGGPSDLPGRFRFPYGLAGDRDGNLIVAEFGNNRVQKIDPKTGGNLGLWGEVGGRPGELRYPWAAAFDAKRGRTVVVDSGNDRLQVIGF